jgi:hypothetical protein
MPKLPVACALLLVLCACSRPEPPPTDQPPEPQAQAPQTELTKAIKRPIDRAEAVEQTVLDAAEKQKADIDAQTGN